MSVDYKRAIFLVVNNASGPCGDDAVPSKGRPLRLAAPNEAEQIKRAIEAMKSAPPIQRLAERLESNFELRRLLVRVLAKGRDQPLADGRYVGKDGVQ